MCVEEAGFAAYYDGLAPGLAGWLRDVISANARTHGIEPESAAWA
ncbi:hypothetical protein AB0E67_12235 [Streptomyces sp. NPDC032161]